MTGKVIRVHLDQGYCFVRGEDSISRFVHATDVIPREAFDTLIIGQPVEFKPGTGQKGPRAVEVRVIS